MEWHHPLEDLEGHWIPRSWLCTPSCEHHPFQTALFLTEFSSLSQSWSLKETIRHGKNPLFVLIGQARLLQQHECLHFLNCDLKTKVIECSLKPQSVAMRSLIRLLRRTIHGFVKQLIGLELGCLLPRRQGLDEMFHTMLGINAFLRM